MNKVRYILLLLFFLLPVTGSQAFAASGGQEAFDAPKVIFEHLKDAYEWHITTIGDKHISIPLPVIVYSERAGWQLFSSSVADIDRMVEEYRQSLLIRKLDQFYVDRLVDTTFTAEELKAYYNSHKSDFKLDRPIVKGCVVRVPKGYRQRARLKELMASKQEARQQDFRDICLKQEFRFEEYTEGWVDWSDFLNQLPTMRSESYDALLNKTGIQEMSDRENYYYFRIDEVRRAGDVVPLERLQQTIRRILFNGRQQQVIRDHEEQLYNASMEEGAVRLYTPDEEN